MQNSSIDSYSRIQNEPHYRYDIGSSIQQLFMTHSTQHMWNILKSPAHRSMSLKSAVIYTGDRLCSKISELSPPLCHFDYGFCIRFGACSIFKCVAPKKRETTHRMLKAQVEYQLYPLLIETQIIFHYSLLMISEKSSKYVFQRLCRNISFECLSLLSKYNILCKTVPFKSIVKDLIR